MNRFILKSKQPDASTFNKSDFSKFRSLYNLSILDDSMFPRMVLVETGDDLVDIASKDFKTKWNIFPETTYQVPDSRKLVKTKKG